MSRAEIERWLRANGWYIAAGGAILVVGTGALVGYFYGGAIVACAGRCGSLLLQNLAAFLDKVPVAISWGRLSIYFGAAAIERAKH